MRCGDKRQTTKAGGWEGAVEMRARPSVYTRSCRACNYKVCNYGCRLLYNMIRSEWTTVLCLVSVPQAQSTDLHVAMRSSPLPDDHAGLTRARDNGHLRRRSDDAVSCETGCRTKGQQSSHKLELGGWIKRLRHSSRPE